MFLLTLDSSELMNALPRMPVPGDSYRPRAKITCASGQLAAADGAAPGAPKGSIAEAYISAAAIKTPAKPTPINRRKNKRRTTRC